MSSQAQTFAYGVAMGLNAGQFECDSCGAARWRSDATATAWIRVRQPVGTRSTTLLLVDDPQAARTLQILARSRYA